MDGWYFSLQLAGCRTTVTRIEYYYSISIKILLLSSCLSGTIGALENSNIKLIQRGCYAPLGYVSTYECTVEGTILGYTVWRGSAFDCTNEEMSLRHRHFTSESGVAGQCNNGSIVGQSLGVQDGQYTSQLNVTVTADIIGKNIECVYTDFDNITILVGSLNIAFPGKKQLIIIYEGRIL